jgi:hypothetical protein
MVRPRGPPATARHLTGTQEPRHFPSVIATNSRVVRDSLGALTVCHTTVQMSVAELGCVSNLFQMSTRLSIYVTYVDSDYLMGLRDWSIPPSCYHVCLVL